MTLTNDLDEIEQVINGEAYTLNLSLMDVAAPNADDTYDVARFRADH